MDDDDSIVRKRKKIDVPQQRQEPSGEAIPDDIQTQGQQPSGEAIPDDIQTALLRSSVCLNSMISSDQLHAIMRRNGCFHSHLSSLSYLDLGCNGLTTLPESFGMLENLKKLYLTSNKLTRLPAAIGGLFIP